MSDMTAILPGDEPRPEIIEAEVARLAEPFALAHAVAVEVAEEPEQVGDPVAAVPLGDGVTDFRLAARIRGYEGWQWSVTLYHDEDAGAWTVNESSLIPTDEALMPPAWIPWKDRLEPTDLAPTDSIGTDPDDPRLEEGFRPVEPSAPVEAPALSEETPSDGEAGVAGETGEASEDEGPCGDVSADMPSAIASAMHSDGVAAEPSDGAARPAAEDGEASDGTGAAESGETASEPMDEAAMERAQIEETAEEFQLTRRHVLSPLGRAQTAKRWYEGPRGPKAMSTKTAAGNPCSTCGFFVPLQGELNLMFGVCANKWSPDDGRVVSLDHGCGEHSEIEPPEPSRLWVQSKPAFDDLHIDIIAQQPRPERGQVEFIEDLEDESKDENEDLATELDIEENTEIDAESEDVASNTVEPDEEPELEAVVDLAVASEETDEGEAEESAEDESEDTDDADEADGEPSGEPEEAAEPSGESDGDADDGQEPAAVEETTDETSAQPVADDGGENPSHGEGDEPASAD